MNHYKVIERIETTTEFVVVAKDMDEARSLAHYYYKFDHTKHQSKSLKVFEAASTGADAWRLISLEVG